MREEGGGRKRERDGGGEVTDKQAEKKVCELTLMSALRCSLALLITSSLSLAWYRSLSLC